MIKIRIGKKLTAPLLSLGLALSISLPSIAQTTATAPRVIAVVEGTQITDKDFEAAYASLPAKVQRRGVDVLYPHILELLVQQNLLVKKGRDAGLATHPAIKAQMKVFESRLIHDAYLNEAVTQRITEDMIQGEYQRYLATVPPGEEVKARHILLRSEQEARNVISLMGQGNDFAALAQQYSTGKSAATGGDLGYFKRGQMVQEFENVAFALNSNTYTADPVQTKFGWHVILVEDKREAPTPTFEQMRPQLMQAIGQAVAFQVTQDMIKNANVMRYDLNGNPISAPANPLPDLRNLAVE